MKRVKLKTIRVGKLTAAQARELFRYDELTGILRWRISLSNRVHVGDIAGSPHNCGYLQVGFNGTKYLVHRVIWLMQTGKWPKEQLDHENHIRSDNRWKNLSGATNQQNSKNSSQRIDNTSGTTGVCWNEHRQQWLAYIMVDRGFKNLGRFTDKQDAIEARKKAEIKYGFHDNHGTVTVTVLRPKKQKHSKRCVLPRTLDRVPLVRLPIAA